MFKNVNQFKKQLTVGQPLHVKNLLKENEEDRIVVMIQSNAFFTGKEISENEYLDAKEDFWTGNGVCELNGKYYTKSYCEYPKASQVKIVSENTLQFLAFEEKTGYDQHSVMNPSPDFKVNDVWLEMNFS